MVKAAAKVHASRYRANRANIAATESTHRFSASRTNAGKGAQGRATTSVRCADDIV